MIKELKRYGNNLMLVFTKAEERIFGMVEGDKVDLGEPFLTETKFPKKKWKKK